MKAIRNIEFVLACLTAFVIPISLKLMPYMIFLWGIFMVIGMGKLHRKARGPMIMMLLLFVLLVVGMTMSDDMKMAKRMLEFKASLGLFPLFHFISRGYTSVNRDRLLRWFCFGVIGFALFTFALAIGRFVSSGDFGFVGYDRLAAVFHPTYLSMYLCLTGYVMLEWGLKDKLLFGSIVNHWVITVFLFVYLGFLGSKAGLACGVVVIVLSLLRHRDLVSKARSNLLGIALVLGALILAVIFAPTTTKRIETALNTELDSSSPETRNSSQVRVLAWQSSWELLQEYPLGVGTGDSTAELNRVYDEKGETYARKRSFNSHNQFLQTGVEHGWPGIVILILMLLTAMRWAWLWRDWIFGAFLLTIVINMLFESILEVQAGVVFVAFFLMVFTNRPKEGMGE